MPDRIQGLDKEDSIPATMTQNTWVENFGSNTRRKFLDIQNEDVANDLRFQFVNNPFALSFDAGDHVDIDTILTALSPILTSPRGAIEARIQNPAAFGQVNTIFGVGDTNANEYLRFYIDNADKKLKAELRTAAAVQWALKIDTAVDALGLDFAKNYYDVKLLQSFAADGSGATPEPKLFINGEKLGQTFTVSTDKTKWINDIQANVDNARIGSLNTNSAGEADQFEGDIDSLTIKHSSDLRHLIDVARYSMKEGTGTSLADDGSEVNGFTGTLGAAGATPTWVSRSVGRVLSRDFGRQFVDNQCPQSAVWLFTAAAVHGTVTLREG